MIKSSTPTIGCFCTNNPTINSPNRSSLTLSQFRLKHRHHSLPLPSPRPQTRPKLQSTTAKMPMNRLKSRENGGNSKIVIGSKLKTRRRTKGKRGRAKKSTSKTQSVNQSSNKRTMDLGSFSQQCSSCGWGLNSTSIFLNIQ